MNRSLSIGLMAAVACGLLAAPTMAQESETVYVRTSSWDVKRTHWATFVENFEKNTQPTLERLFEAGVINEWGISSNAVHSENGYTHDIWWASTSLASLERVLDELDESASEDDRRQRAAELAGAISKHEDNIGRSLIIKTRPTRADDGYLMSSRVKVRPGEGGKWRRLWEAHVQPIYDKLLEDGTIHAYGIDRQYVHTRDPRYRTVWHTVPSLEAEAKLDAAFREVWQSRSEAEADALGTAMQSVADRSEHRDSMSRIIHYAVK